MTEISKSLAELSERFDAMTCTEQIEFALNALNDATERGDIDVVNAVLVPLAITRNRVALLEGVNKVEIIGSIPKGWADCSEDGECSDNRGCSLWGHCRSLLGTLRYRLRHLTAIRNFLSSIGPARM